MTTTVQQVLDTKGRQVLSVPPEASVYEALERMAEADVGALVVEREGRLLGMITERDYARKVILRGRSSPTTRVSETLTWPVAVVQEDDTVERCMELMTNLRVRHLPVLDGERIIGLISQGDLVKAIIDEQQRTIAELGFSLEELQRYIYGDYSSVG